MKVDIIGDVHGCYDELLQLLNKLKYEKRHHTLFHPNERTVVFLGDLTDRGPDSLRVIELVYTLVKNKQALYTPGNHCNKLYRYFLKRNVQIKNGLETTVAELQQTTDVRRKEIAHKFMYLVEQAPPYIILDSGKLIVAHAGILREHIGKINKRIKAFALYGDTTGKLNEDGTPERRDWAKNYDGDAFIVYGHTPVQMPRFLNNTVNIDTGCVFGGHLTALRYPEKEVVQVPSLQPFIPNKFRSFPAP